MSEEIKNRRGFELTCNSTIGIALVKTDAKKVSEHLAEACNGEIKKIERIQDFNFTNFKYTDLVVQYQAHLYSIFCQGFLFKNIIINISKILKTRCLHFEYEDCSGASGYSLYQDGICLESYIYGIDYA